MFDTLFRFVNSYGCAWSGMVRQKSGEMSSPTPSIDSLNGALALCDNSGTRAPPNLSSKKSRQAVIWYIHTGSVLDARKLLSDV